MPQHSSQECGESNGRWLPLIEYSVRSGLSLSTIRRKIKSNSLQFRMENGRYLILFEETGRMASFAPQQERVRPVSVSMPPPVQHVSPVSSEEARTESEMESAVKMVSEAFEHALREKDERIHLLERNNRALEERLNELRLLVKVLEEKYEVRY